MVSSNHKVLVSGSAGFIGSHLTRKLIGEGHQVCVIKRKDSNLWRIKDLVGKVLIYDDVDLRDTDNVLKAISSFKPDTVFHLATYYAVEHKPEEISLMVDTNVLGTTNLLEASMASEVGLFVNTSSCFVYGEDLENVGEGASLSPLNLYALTKMQAEQACDFYTDNSGLRAVTFRLFPPFGPADHERRLIPYVIRSFYNEEPLRLTTGTQRWDFTYVDDIVEAYTKLLTISSLPNRHEIFNIGTGKATSVLDVVSKIKEFMGVTYEPEWGAVPHRKNEVWLICADINKANTLLSWKPSKPLEERIESTVNWYKLYLSTSGEKTQND